MGCSRRDGRKQRCSSYACSLQKSATELRAIVPTFAGEEGEATQYIVDKFNEAIIFLGIPTDDGRGLGSFGTGAPWSSV